MAVICGVYEIRSPSGNRYIGSSLNISARWTAHRNALKRGRHHSPQLQRAWNKHKQFVFKTLLVCAPELLLMYEQRVIDGLKPKYNAAKTAGAAMLGVSHTPEAKAKISQTSKKKWADDPSYRAMMSNQRREMNKAQPITEAARKKAAVSLKKLYAESAEAREACSLRNSKSSRASWRDSLPDRREAAAQRLAARNRKKQWTPEERKAMSDKKKAFYAANPQAREHLAALGRKQIRSESVKDKIADGLKRAYAEGRRK